MSAFKKITKALLWIMALLLVVLLIALLVRLLDWETSTVITVMLSVTGVVAVGSLVVYLWRRRQQRPANAAHAAADTPELRNRLQQIDTVWKRAVKLIRGSRLKERGDPLYILPWYLVLGEKSVGASSAVKNSRVAIPLADGKGEKGDADLPTWWLMDESVVIDAPGRYAVPETAADKAEWHRFKSLFLKYRRWEPVNGVVVAVSADRLMSAGEDALKDYATRLKGQLKDLSQIFGIRFPVYVLITKVDRIAGMSRFFAHFPESSLAQAMGALTGAGDAQASIEQQVEDAFRDINERLNQLRLDLLGEANSSGLTAQAIGFPEEIAAMQHRVALFSKFMLDKALYQEAPVFRGLYFSSAHQEGTPISSFLPAERLGAANQSATDRSFFLKGFFGQVLKSDRSLVQPTTKAIFFARLKQNVGVASWVAVCGIAVVFLSASFLSNLSALRETHQGLPVEFVLKNDLDSDINLLHKFRGAVAALEQHNNDAWLPNFGLNQTESVAERLATVYSRKLKEAVLIPFEKTFGGDVQALSAQTPPAELAGYVDFMTKRVALMQAVQKEPHSANLADLGQPDYRLMLTSLDKFDQDRLAVLMQDNYLAYLQWTSDPRVLEKELELENHRLKQTLSREGVGFVWLTEWANLQTDIDPIVLKDYWGNTPPNYENVSVPRAFTPKGWSAIDAFSTQIEHAIGDPALAQRSRSQFLENYRRDYFAAWKKFLEDFHFGATASVGRERNLDLASRLAGKNSPYAKLFADLPNRLLPVTEAADTQSPVPAWVDAAYRYANLNDPEYQKALKGADGVLGIVAKKGGKLFGKMKSALNGADGGQSVMAADQKALPYLLDYGATLTKMADQTKAPQAAFELAKAVYSEAGAVAGDPTQLMTKNQWDLARMREYLAGNDASELIFWTLLEQQAEQIWGVVMDEAALHIQQIWQNDLLAQATGLNGWQKVEALQGQSGKIWDFHKDYTGPFVENSRIRGNTPKELYHHTLPLSKAFLAVLNQGKVSQQALNGVHSVQVSAVPTDVNRNASVKPHLTKLVLQCAAGDIELLNYNYPVRKTFNWSPMDCGDVRLEINISDIVLEKRYSGYNGFIKFLKDFRTGRKVFQRRDFPEQQGRLAGYGISRITVGFSFSGQDSAIRLALKDPSLIPDKVIVQDTQMTNKYAGQ